MDRFEQVAIEEALKSELGKTASFSRYDRGNRTPMNFVLDEVERQLGPTFLVYWVDGGSPEVFCLPGFSLIPVVFSTRYLDLSAFVRHVIVEPFEGDLRAEVAERTALKLIAELALRHGNPEFAALAFLKSIVGKGIFLNDGNRLMELEYQPINEAYMATWFYGLLHELGHISHQPIDQFAGGGAFSDEWIVHALTTALNTFPYPASLKRKAVEKATRHRSDFLLGIDHLCGEGIADIFATSILFQTTFDIMKKVKKDTFRIHRFIQEMTIFLNIVGFIERCRKVAIVASTPSPDMDAALDVALHPVAVYVRALMARVYLEYAVAVIMFHTNEPTPEQQDRVNDAINEINNPFKNRIDTIDTGLARAMEFALFPERRQEGQVLLEKFQNEVSPLSGGQITLLEAQRFCELADSAGVRSEMLQALRHVVSKE
jgi:hypothetical protein